MKRLNDGDGCVSARVHDRTYYRVSCLGYIRIQDRVSCRVWYRVYDRVYIRVYDRVSGRERGL